MIIIHAVDDFTNYDVTAFLPLTCAPDEPAGFIAFLAADPFRIVPRNCPV